ncbi:MAG TPA: PQQ-binding-like beta-propeller repeat protein [Ktedonobacteraceae bacterium]|nr:PQQ-binding-like beta-propeller repeat protein [Ktedonobacteraceae bacterium]
MTTSRSYKAGLLLLCIASVLAGCNSANTGPSGQTPVTYSIVYGCSDDALTTKSSLPPSHITAYIASFSGSLYAFDTGNGVLRWCLHIQAHGSFSAYAKVAGLAGPPPIPVGLSTPVLAGGILFTDSEDGYVYAFKADTGSLLWQTQSPTGIAYDIGQGPAVVNSTVYASSSNGLFALNAWNGVLRWQSLSGVMLHGTPVIAGNTVYVGADNGKMYAVDASTGALRWQFQTSTEIQTSPVVVNGILHLVNHDGSAYALDAATGKALWRSRTGYLITPWITSGDGRLYITASDSFIYTLDAATGKLLWRYQTSVGIYAPPSLNNGVLYVASSGIYSLRASDGQLLWHNILDTHLYGLTTPTILRGIIYTTSQGNGSLAPAAMHELRAQDGQLLFSFPIGYNGSNSAPAIA